MDFPTIYILTDAGKPVYARTDEQDERETSRICSFLSSICSSIIHGTLELGNFKSISSASLRISFMVVKSLILVAVSKLRRHEVAETVLFQRLILEHLYLNLLNTLTDNALTLVERNPSFDLSSLIDDVDMSCDLFRTNGPFIYTGSFLTGGVEPFFPISPHVRDAASLILKSLCSDRQFYQFALILTDSKLVTIVQSPHRHNHIKTSDLLHFVMFLRRQRNILTDELWLPFCFPRLDSSGFLHCYTNCLDVATRTIFVLVSQDPSSLEQCRADTASKVRPKLGLPAFAKESVIQIIEDQAIKRGLNELGTDVKWRRSCIDDKLDDSDYEWVPYDNEQLSTALLREIQAAYNCCKSELLLKDIMGSDGIRHFVFRVDVPVSTTSGLHDEVSQLAFTLSSQGPPSDAPSTWLLWSTYRKLSLRLRHGSAASKNGPDDLSGLIDYHSPNDNETICTADLRYCCPASHLIETIPIIQGLCHVSDGNMTYVAMNGQGFDTFEL